VNDTRMKYRPGGARQKYIPAPQPLFEYIQMEAMETFIWRLDDYPWRRNVWNFHPEYEIHLIRNASGVSLVGDHIGRFEPGYLCIVGGGLPHNWITEVEPGNVITGRDIVLQFDAERLRQAGSLLPELVELDEFLTRAKLGLEFRGRTARVGQDLLEKMGGVHGTERLGLFIGLLTLLSRSDESIEISSSGFAPNRDEASMDIIHRVHAYVFERLRSEIRLSDAARIAEMSENGFSRFFKKNSGNSFTDYVTKLRIVLACKLLVESQKPVTDICFEVGYTNISNFNRLFRKLRGITPSTYRQQAARRARPADMAPA
jgi:AraC-like DNA-binding protein